MPWVRHIPLLHPVPYLGALRCPNFVNCCLASPCALHRLRTFRAVQHMPIEHVRTAPATNNSIRNATRLMAQPEGPLPQIAHAPTTTRVLPRTPVHKSAASALLIIQTSDKSLACYFAWLPRHLSLASTVNTVDRLRSLAGAAMRWLALLGRLDRNRTSKSVRAIIGFHRFIGLRITHLLFS